MSVRVSKCERGIERERERETEIERETETERERERERETERDRVSASDEGRSVTSVGLATAHSIASAVLRRCQTHFNPLFSLLLLLLLLFLLLLLLFFLVLLFLYSAGPAAPSD